MNLSIRDYIKKNFKNSDINELRNSINESVNSEDEVVLPGLGVMFEILWNNSDNKNEIIEIINNNIH